jgi:HK97 gp10 family phage protein
MNAAQAHAYNTGQKARLRHQLHLATGVPFQAAEDAAPIIAQDLLSEIKTSLVGPGTGRIYRRYNPFRIHQASAPGLPPATDLGRLTNSYYLVAIRSSKARQRIEIEVGSNLEYSVYLELGTRKMKPRPHVRPAGRRTAAKVPGILIAQAAKQAAQIKAGS